MGEPMIALFSLDSPGPSDYVAIVGGGSRGFGFIRKWSATDAAAYEGRRLRDGLLDKTNTAAVKLSLYDPLAVRRLAAKLRELAGGADAALKGQLIAVAEATWRHFYGLPSESDTAFILGTVLHACGAWAEASEYYRRSLEVDGLDAHTYFNLGMCDRALDNRKSAIANFKRAIELNPDFEAPRRRYEEIVREMNSIPADQN